ncbi:MAG: cytC [Chitinophagaceae bacterium]|nr:cytC [Chitinophagaceae bacterium]
MKLYANRFLFLRFLFSCLLVALPLLSFANTGGSTASVMPEGVPDPKDLLDILILSICIFVILVLLYMMYLLNMLMNYIKPAAARKPLFAGLIQKLSDAVPIEEEHSILTDHDYDGIRELDNNLPLWWKYMFYLTIVCAGCYIYYYHFSGVGKLQIAEYQEEVATSEKEVEAYMKLAANSVDENNVKRLIDAKKIESGKTLFLQNCAACHGKGGEGGVGPNLTDEYWLHGGGVKNVFKTIKYGVPEKGMISWKTQLSPANIQEVTSYILTLKGAHPANPKAPQGDPYEEEDITIK